MGRPGFLVPVHPGGPYLLPIHMLWLRQLGSVPLGTPSLYHAGVRDPTGQRKRHKAGQGSCDPGFPRPPSALEVWACKAQSPPRGGAAGSGPAQSREGQKRLGAAWPGASWSRMYCRMSISSMAWICCGGGGGLAAASDGPALGAAAGFLGGTGLAATGGLGLGRGWGLVSAPRFRIWSKSSSTLGNQRESPEHSLLGKEPMGGRPLPLLLQLNLVGRRA